MKFQTQDQGKISTLAVLIINTFHQAHSSLIHISSFDYTAVVMEGNCCLITV